MRRLLILPICIGGILLVMGVLPFIFAYPFSNGGENSGPSNVLEFILMISYENQVSSLLIGVVITFLPLLLIRKRKNP